MAVDVYQKVTDKIIALLEGGTVPWEKPWNGYNRAFNRVSKKCYSLLNQYMLSYTGEYASFKQWKELGGSIKKGAKAEFVVFWKLLKKEEEDEVGNKRIKTIPYLNYNNVFHISQVEGVESLEKDQLNDIEKLEEPDSIFSEYVKREGITFVQENSNKAYYSPKKDEIHLPLMEQFKTQNGYYGVMFHESIHSTGHKDRLKRFGLDDKIAAFGSADYSREELIAEMGSAMILGRLGIDTDKTDRNTAAYIQSWLKPLKNDKKMVVSAASKAEKAVEYILTGKKGNNNGE